MKVSKKKLTELQDSKELEVLEKAPQKGVSRRDLIKLTGLAVGSTLLGAGLVKPSTAEAEYVSAPTPKIDIYTHIMPPKYTAAFIKKNDKLANSRELENTACVDLNMRLRLMDRHPEVMHMLTLSLPPVESLLSPKDALAVSQVANDELAEIVETYPDKFIGAAACLPLNDMTASLKELDRAMKLKLKGVEITTFADGKYLDDKYFWPIYEKMAEYNLPIWIHPCPVEGVDPLLGWLHQTGDAMRRLVIAGVFTDFPEIKFVTHHSGSMIPQAAGRIEWSFKHVYPHIKDPLSLFRNFYADTVTNGDTSALTAANNFFGADHMLFGTDTPLGPEWGLTSEIIRSVERMAIPNADKEKIFLENAMKLLNVAV
jgi:predicted TIM-barrel fold metal-dependent hydrolase